MTQFNQNHRTVKVHRVDRDACLLLAANIALWLGTLML